MSQHNIAQLAYIGSGCQSADLVTRYAPGAEAPEDALGPEQEIAMVLQFLGFLVGHSASAGRRFGLILGVSNVRPKPTRGGIGLYPDREPLWLGR
jgi:hypothetical protein